MRGIFSRRKAYSFIFQIVSLCGIMVSGAVSNECNDRYYVAYEDGHSLFIYLKRILNECGASLRLCFPEAEDEG